MQFHIHSLNGWSSEHEPFFLFHRRLRSYEIRNAPRGSHCGGVGAAAEAAAAGVESCQTGFFFM